MLAAEDPLYTSMDRNKVIWILLFLFTNIITTEHCLCKWSILWLIHWLVDWLVDWLIDWLIDLFIYLLAGLCVVLSSLVKI